MNEKKELQDEIRSITNGLPVPSDDVPPAAYFDQLPDVVLNRWKNEGSTLKTKTISWQHFIAIAAILTGVCIGLFFITLKDDAPAPYTSAEAYLYIRENIDDFEGLLEYSDQVPKDESWDVPSEAIHEYLMEESSEELIEDIF